MAKRTGFSNGHGFRMGFTDPNERCGGCNVPLTERLPKSPAIRFCEPCWHLAGDPSTPEQREAAVARFNNQKEN